MMQVNKYTKDNFIDYRDIISSLDDNFLETKKWLMGIDVHVLIIYMLLKMERQFLYTLDILKNMVMVEEVYSLIVEV